MVEKDFKELLNWFGESHLACRTIEKTSRGLTGDQKDDMFDYVEKYIFDVRFRQEIAPS